MTLYYQDDYITIFHGDCLEILPSLVGIDSIVTDPPYGLDMQARMGGSRSNLAAALDDYFIIGDNEPFNPAHLLPFENVIIWGANHFSSKLPDSRGWLVWDKREAGTPDNQADCELAWANFDCPARLYHHLWRGMIKASEQSEKRNHPMQKPVSLMRWCIQQIKQPGLICDPYTGSGSTLVAAKQLGLKAIGVEIVESYCEVSARRVSQTSVMFPEVRVLASPGQAPLFSEVA